MSKNNLPTSVFIVHSLFTDWTEHSTQGVYSSKEKAYDKVLKILEENDSSIEECEEADNDIEFAINNHDKGFSIWITENEIE